MLKDKVWLISEITNKRIKNVIKQNELNQGFKVYKQNKSTIYKWQDFIPQQDGIIPISLVN